MGKKIAIMTWYTYNNYGSVLQAYALRKKLVDMGNDKVDFVNYQPTSKSLSLKEKLAFTHLKEVFWTTYYKNEIKKKMKDLFDDFREEHFTYTDLSNTKRELYMLNNHYDKFICGSDQIWAPTLFDENYFLNFVDSNEKKIAYAPSIGLSSIEDSTVKVQIKELINAIPYLSIREKRGQEIIKELTGKEAKIVLDPTLLFDKSEWNDIFKLENFHKKDYILVYCLGDMKNAFKIAKKFHKDIIVIPQFYSDYHRYKKYCMIPNLIDFLKLIYHADMVITDSFHGTIFSINFNVPFITLKRFKDDKKSQNSRIYSILEMVGLEKRLYSGKNIINEGISFEDVNMIVQNKRKDSILYLKNAIEAEVTEKNEQICITNVCTGCGACVATCPQNCLSIKLNEEGFYQYEKDETKCTHCNICRLVCAQLKNEKQDLSNKELFAFNSNNEEVLKNSSSGGFAYEISKWGIENGYKIVGCSYDQSTHKAKHVVMDNISNLNKLSGSKYIQSDMQDALKEIIRLDKAIIIGTPCQIASIDNLLKIKKKRNNFILIDLICHGVPSYYLWINYINTKIDTTQVRFRDKKYGWRTKTMTTDGKAYEKEDDNLFYDFFSLGNVYNESCYECQYRDASCADIRIGDFWGPKYEKNELGVSMIIPCTKVGYYILNEMDHKKVGTLKKEDISDYYSYQQTKNNKKPFEREKIIQDLKYNNKSLAKLSNIYCKPYKKERKKYRFLMNRFNNLKKIYHFIKKRK